MACVRGRRDSVAVYIQRPTSNPNTLVVLGLYPPADAKCDSDCATAKEMRKRLDPQLLEEFTWVDLCVLSSTSTNAIIDQRAIADFVHHESIVRDYFRRFATYLRELPTDRPLCVYVAGDTCQAAFEKAINLGLVVRLGEPGLHGTSLCTIDGREFLALEGHPHPSWVLMTGRAPRAVRVFRETMCTLNGMARWRNGDPQPLAQLDALVEAELGDAARAIAARVSCRPLLTEMLYDADHGRFPAKHKHLPHVDAHVPGVLALLQKWYAREAGPCSRLKINY
jgi:hypothetical protein